MKWHHLKWKGHKWRLLCRSQLGILDQAGFRFVHITLKQKWGQLGKWKGHVGKRRKGRLVAVWAKRPEIVSIHHCTCSVPLPAAVDRALRYNQTATVPSLGIISCWCGLCSQQDLTGLLVSLGGWRALTLMIKACLFIHPIQYSSATFRNVLRSEIREASGGRAMWTVSRGQSMQHKQCPWNERVMCSLYSLL